MVHIYEFWFFFSIRLHNFTWIQMIQISDAHKFQFAFANDGWLIAWNIATSSVFDVKMTKQLEVIEKPFGINL